MKKPHHSAISILPILHIILSDDRPARPPFPRKHGALHSSVHPRCSNCLHGRDRSRPGQQQPRDPERAGSEALHSSGQRTHAAVGGAGVSQSPVRARCRAVVLEVIPGAGGRPDHGGDCVVEVGDRDIGMEDADGDIVPGVFSFCPYPVCGALR